MASVYNSPWEWTTTTSSNSTWFANSTGSYTATSPWTWTTTSTTTYNFHTVETRYIEPTPEEIEFERQLAIQRRAEQERRVASQEAQRRQEAEAQQRAERLLLEHLDETETERWQAKGEIHGRAPRGRRHCIRGDKRQHNAFALDESGTPVKELCVHIDAACPLADNVLAQKLALEHAEDHLLAAANTWDLVGGRRAR